MSGGWRDLRTELQRWQDSGLTATFWWRDDDARDVSIQLDRLLRVAGELHTALALAVIPVGATNALMQRLRAAPPVDVLQHGYAHLNHSPDAEKKSEFGNHRGLPAQLAELRDGQRRLETLFGACLPVLVPPWNRIDQRVVECLARLGFAGLSTSGGRAAAVDTHGLRHVNTHVDPVAWRGNRGFCGEPDALRQVLQHLSARRAGSADRAEPTGLLTHHLVQDDACWSFCERLIAETSAFDNVRWLAARALFPR